MAKISCKVGFGISVEKSPGVWIVEEQERPYIGLLTRNNFRWQGTEDINDDLNISNQLSILADSFAISNFQYLKYVSYLGTKWKVTNVDVQYPRLILTFGGVYNG